MRSSLRILPIIVGIFVVFSSFPALARSRVDTSFIPQLHPVLPIQLDNKQDIQAQQIWQEIISKGYSVHQGTDKTMRPIFGQIQAHLEQQMINSFSQIPLGSTLWIIHTPLIATPLVTNDEVSKTLVSSEIQNTALARAKIMREYLAKGGLLVVAYQSNLREGKSGRTQDQIAIFEALKQQYPKQVVEFPIDVNHFPNGSFPRENIGATYLTQMPSGNIVEMTNLGVQINGSREDAMWGVWLQERNDPQTAVNSRLTSSFQFLFANGLHNVLTKHAHQQGIAPEKVLALLARFSTGEDSPHEAIRNQK